MIIICRVWRLPLAFWRSPVLCRRLIPTSPQAVRHWSQRAANGCYEYLGSLFPPLKMDDGGCLARAGPSSLFLVATKFASTPHVWSCVKDRRCGLATSTAHHAAWSIVSKSSIPTISLNTDYRPHEGRHSSSLPTAVLHRLNGICQDRAMATRGHCVSVPDNPELGYGDELIPLLEDSEEILMQAILYEAQEGFTNVQGRSVRFSDFLHEQLKSKDWRTKSSSILEVTRRRAACYAALVLADRSALLNLVVTDILHFKSLKEAQEHYAAAVAAEDSDNTGGGKQRQILSSSELPAAQLNGPHIGTAEEARISMTSVHAETEAKTAIGALRKNVTAPVRGKETVANHNRSLPGINAEAVNEGTDPRPPSDLGKDDADVYLSDPTLKEAQLLSLLADCHPAIQYGASERIDLPGHDVLASTLPIDGFEHVALLAEELRQGAKQTADSRPAEIAVNGTERRGQDGLDKAHVRDIVMDYKSAKGGQHASVKDEPLKLTSQPGVVTNLDMSLSAISGLTTLQLQRLHHEKFFTVRQLLQHFPRTYVDYQNPAGQIQEGQHVVLEGTIISSRGRSLKAGFNVIDIVMKLNNDEVAEGAAGDILYRTSKSEAAERSSDEPAPGHEPVYDPSEVQNTPAAQSEPVFIHLNRFLRGRKFSWAGFLNKLAAQYPVGSVASVTGKVKALEKKNHFEIQDYTLTLMDGSHRTSLHGDQDHLLHKIPRPSPVYPAKGMLQPKVLGNFIARFLRLLPESIDPLPLDLRENYDLMGLQQAYHAIHAPQCAADAVNARSRLVFDEFFYHQLALLVGRQQTEDAYASTKGLDATIGAMKGRLPKEGWSELPLKLLDKLPFHLTASQMIAAEEITWDLRRPLPMSRLLQGDVGCGKTIIAMLALLEIVSLGYQGAMMAPTEFLAQQHHARLSHWLQLIDEQARPSLALLTGSTAVKKARAIREAVGNGEVKVIIGTHSLLSEGVNFAQLGLAVIDEQHRFGVQQRARLHGKGSRLPQTSDEVATPGALLLNPHVLAMSATPIPRTLALALHGDMAISQISELPPGRPPITTRALLDTAHGRLGAYQILRKEVLSGGRAFVVFPMINESLEYPEVRAARAEFENLTADQKFLGGLMCQLVHGQMLPSEKALAMANFKEGKIQVLLATTVIEVGIDVPEATVMLVEHAERYGLAQLHQLRGRVGRGARKSTCLLLGSTSSSMTRLHLLEQSQDGFFLAEMDLRMRGPGDVLGKRQSGHLPEFSLARLDEDGNILVKARQAAEDIAKAHRGLHGLPLLQEELRVRHSPIAFGQ